MYKGFWAVGLCFIAGLGMSCGNKMETREAVQRGVIEGVRKRGVNVEAMDVRVSSVSFHGKQADAVVAFAPKGATATDGLMMRYTLEQQGEQWVIKGRAQMDMNQHAMPPGQTGAKPMPIPGHDNMGADSEPPLQAGHPPLNPPPAGTQP